MRQVSMVENIVDDILHCKYELTKDEIASYIKDIDKIIYQLYGLSVLSKILCKWKQDSVVSLFLYLDSVFKYKHKLVHNQSPV